LFPPHLEEDRLADLRHDAAPAGLPSPEEEAKEGEQAMGGRRSREATCAATRAEGFRALALAIEMGIK